MAILAVAKYSSFIAAASELHISQPGLSRMIRNVEDELGASLFERTTRQVTLTSAGTEFIPLAERILRDLELGIVTMRELRAQARGFLAISCTMSLATNALPKIIFEYKRLYPNVTLQIQEGIQSSISEDIRLGHADFGIGDVLEPSDDLLVDVLCTTHYRVVFCKDHRFAGRSRVSLRDLRDEPLVSMPATSNIRRIFDGAAASDGFRLNHTITANTYSAVAELVHAGVGITILASTSLPDDPRLCSCRITPPVFTGTLAIMRLKTRLLSAAASGFQTLVKRHFRGL
jgi:DNA-binding transcriptional LysR family regulator